jgi:hypothetical protein
MSTTLAKICNQEALGRKSVWISARLRSTSVSEVTDIFHYVPTSNWRLMLRKHWIEKGICKGVHSETPLDRHPTLGTYREVQLLGGKHNSRAGDTYDLFVLRLLNGHRSTHSTVANVDLTGANPRYRTKFYQSFRAVARR